MSDVDDLLIAAQRVINVARRVAQNGRLTLDNEFSVGRVTGEELCEAVDEYDRVRSTPPNGRDAAQ